MQSSKLFKIKFDRHTHLSSLIHSLNQSLQLLNLTQEHSIHAAIMINESSQSKNSKSHYSLKASIAIIDQSNDATQLFEETSSNLDNDENQSYEKSIEHRSKLEYSNLSRHKRRFTFDFMFNDEEFVLKSTNIVTDYVNEYQVTNAQDLLKLMNDKLRLFYDVTRTLQKKQRKTNEQLIILRRKHDIVKINLDKLRDQRNVYKKRTT